MAPKMLLQIIPEALTPEKDSQFMRTGSLSALKKLSTNSVRLIGERSRLSEEMQQLLEQEQIDLEDTAAIDPDQLRSSHRVNCDADGKLVLDPETPDARTCTDWPDLARHLLTTQRTASHQRKTGETDISVTINLDGTGKSVIHTGLPFYDHMLEQIARHGYMDLNIQCDGDLEIDEHHTIEDTAITLGEAIGMALGDKRGIGRYGFMVAMDETRSLVALDLSGRPWCEFEGAFHREKVGDFPTEMTRHFFHSLAMSLKATLHVAVKGENDHHQIEACFKGLARALRQAVDHNENYRDILPSSKGLL